MRIDVFNIAKLANLTLKKNEEKIYKSQISSILNYIEKLKEVDTKNVSETSQVTNLENVTKEDTTSPSFSQEKALSNTKNKHNGFFKVKAIFE